MGLWEAMRARTTPRRNHLDALFLVPSAAITLQTALGFEPTGSGSVCYRSASGAAFAQTQADVVSLIRDDAEAPDVTVSTDDFGFTWLVVDGDPADMSALCTDLHAGNVLRADRQPWLMIDPKPHVGDPTYDALQHMLNCPARLHAEPDVERHLPGARLRSGRRAPRLLVRIALLRRQSGTSRRTTSVSAGHR